jgi:sugar O-acyltransferase (sialic acid O-acetyltransferase NeuD family)
MKNVIIFGASGHGSVILDSIEQQGNYQVIGFADSFKKKGRRQNGYEILGNEFDLPFLIEKFNLFGVIIAIGDNWIRKKVADKIARISPKLTFITIIHPDATIGKDVNIGKGTVIMPGAIVNANCSIGDFCILNTNSSLDHDSHMDHFSSLAPRVCTGGNLSLGRFSAVCLGANIIENITIEEQTVIGAGSLVISSIESYVVAYGSPARVIRNRKAGDSYLTGLKNPVITPSLAANDL